jgi:hypothetical protein
LNIPPEIARSIAAGDPAPDGLSEKEKAAYNQRKGLALAYLIEQATRPQTIGYSLSDSPAGLAAWMLDHDPRSYEQLAKAFEGHPEGSLTRDQILDNITLYWVTNTGTSAARLYWENARTVYKGQVSLPTDVLRATSIFFRGVSFAENLTWPLAVLPKTQSPAPASLSRVAILQRS